ncbi:hypothetical protein [Phaeovulum sp.]|uniref:hypothetical protein n=1 Tax=Phaeovulum sp. TaxID=2934796 RepID=UPI0039E4663A
MTQYRQDLTDSALSTLLNEEPVKVTSLEDLAHLASRLPALGEWVHSMEVNEHRGEKVVGRIDFAIMGLDGEDDWDTPLEPSRMRALLEDKITRMRASGLTFSFDLWMGELA